MVESLLVGSMKGKRSTLYRQGVSWFEKIDLPARHVVCVRYGGRARIPLVRAQDTYYVTMQ
jgi:hypothetical protein